MTTIRHLNLFIGYRSVGVETQLLLDFLYLGHTFLLATGIASCALHSALDLEVELNLRLGSRWSYAKFGAILAEPLQHIAGSRHIKFGDIALAIGLGQALEVLRTYYLASCEVLGRIVAEVGHHLLDFVGTSLARLNHIDGKFL